MADQDEIAAAQVVIPPMHMEAVTPSDTVDFDEFTRGIYVGVSGNVSVVPAGDQGAEAVTLVGLAAGIFHPMILKRVNLTGTVATSIVAAW